MYKWKVISSPYPELESTLQGLDDDGWEIFEVIPHRQGKEVVAEVVARKRNCKTCP